LNNPRPIPPYKVRLILWVTFILTQLLFLFVLHTICKEITSKSFIQILENPRTVPLILMTPVGWILSYFLPGKLFPKPVEKIGVIKTDPNCFTRSILTYVLIETSSLFAFLLSFINQYPPYANIIIMLSVGLMFLVKPAKDA